MQVTTQIVDPLLMQWPARMVPEMARSLASPLSQLVFHNVRYRFCPIECAFQCIEAITRTENKVCMLWKASGYTLLFLLLAVVVVG